jgi:hypothetical protein
MWAGPWDNTHVSFTPTLTLMLSSLTVVGTIGTTNPTKARRHFSECTIAMGQEQQRREACLGLELWTMNRPIHLSLRASLMGDIGSLLEMLNQLQTLAGFLFLIPRFLPVPSPKSLLYFYHSFISFIVYFFQFIYTLCDRTTKYCFFFICIHFS